MLCGVSFPFVSRSVALFIADFVLRLLAAPVRHRTDPDDIFGDAAQQQMRQSRKAMGFHDDHLAIQLHGGIDNGWA